MLYEDEFFGDPRKIVLSKRSMSLWKLLKSNPSFSYYGRAVALTIQSRDSSCLIQALAKIQGVGVGLYVKKSEVTGLFSDFKNNGFLTDRHEHYRGAKESYEVSKEVLKKYTLPNDLSVLKLNEKTSKSLVKSAALLCDSCGVMPVPGLAMRGKFQAGLNLIAFDKDQKVVSSASAFFLHHKENPNYKDVMWGMLATKEDRRGEKISLILGAKIIIKMWEKFGARGFITGVRSENLASVKLCNKLGLYDTEWVYAQCIDTELLGTARVTK